MRSTVVIGVLAGLVGSAAPAWAQTFPAQTTIVAPQVDVRSGPTDKFYPTLQLHQGDPVLAVGLCKEQPGWLEIRPPEGSFNWINAKYVKQMGPWAVVIDDDAKFEAPALVGSRDFKDKPNKQAKRGYLAGSILQIVSEKFVDGADVWLPVKPDARDVRYIPATAVNLPTAPPTITAPATWAIGNKATNPPTAVIPGYPSGGASDVKPAASTTSLSPTPVAPSITPTTPAITNPPAWSQWGKLQTASFRSKDGLPMYVLVNDRGEPLLYVTSRAGTNLSGYVNRKVCLYGPTVYRADERITVPYMIASHVAVP